MKRLACAFTLSLLVGCGGAASSVPKVAEAERTRATLQGRDPQTLAPQAFAEADQALRAAKEAERAGDTTAADLHAERAVAAFQHAIALARLTRATDDETEAKTALAQAVEQSQRYAAARQAAEREADDLDKQLKIAREAERPGPSGPADPERERARLIAAQSLATQARLLCSAARLVSPQAPGLAEAETAAADLEKKLESAPRPAPIDAAGRARAACLAALTKARRTGAPEADQADALLGELSRSVDPKAKGVSVVSPARDERGVIVTLRSLFSGTTPDKSAALSTEGEAALKELGRVAAAHPTFSVQIVVHDATRPSAAEAALDKKRGDAVAKALIDGGASAAKTKVDQAGARAPVIDPSDAKRRDRNARVDIVFVNGS
jgi:outer membrane protein OmpA-like peptidoglycan-associated protein